MWSILLQRPCQPQHCLLSSAHPHSAFSRHYLLELQTKVKRRFAKISQSQESPQLRAFSWLKAPTRAFTFKTLLRYYAKQAPKHSKWKWNWQANAKIIKGMGGSVSIQMLIIHYWQTLHARSFGISPVWTQCEYSYANFWSIEKSSTTCLGSSGTFPLTGLNLTTGSVHMSLPSWEPIGPLRALGPLVTPSSLQRICQKPDKNTSYCIKIPNKYKLSWLYLIHLNEVRRPHVEEVSPAPVPCFS